MTESERQLLTLDYKGRDAKREVLRQLVREVIEQCAKIAECDYPASASEERVYGAFIASEIRRLQP